MHQWRIDESDRKKSRLAAGLSVDDKPKLAVLSTSAGGVLKVSARFFIIFILLFYDAHNFLHFLLRD